MLKSTTCDIMSKALETSISNAKHTRIDYLPNSPPPPINIFDQLIGLVESNW